jgi:hypothetical protein
MIPRLKSSIKWTALPSELCTQIREVFEENFADATKLGRFIISGRIYPHELCFRAGYLENGRLRQANFEVSLDFNAAKQNAFEQIQVCVDCAASMMDQYLEMHKNIDENSVEDDLDTFPHQWQENQFDGRKLFLQVSTENSDLEAEANKLLGDSADSLVVGNDPSDDEQAVISILGLGGPNEASEDFGDDHRDETPASRIPPKTKSVKPQPSTKKVAAPRSAATNPSKRKSVTKH